MDERAKVLIMNLVELMRDSQQRVYDYEFAGTAPIDAALHKLLRLDAGIIHQIICKLILNDFSDVELGLADITDDFISYMRASGHDLTYSLPMEARNPAYFVVTSRAICAGIIGSLQILKLLFRENAQAIRIQNRIVFPGEEFLFLEYGFLQG